MRKGITLLKSVRQLEAKPRAEQLSPTRLHNVTAIERMLVQLGQSTSFSAKLYFLEETERSFDAFWSKHETRLTSCLQLRQFEDSFRKVSERREAAIISEKCIKAALTLRELRDPENKGSYSHFFSMHSSAHRSRETHVTCFLLPLDGLEIPVSTGIIPL